MANQYVDEAYDPLNPYAGFHERSEAGIGGTKMRVIANAFAVQPRK